MNSLYLGYGLLLLLIMTFAFMIYKTYNSSNTTEGFNPRRWWLENNWRWGWRRPWLHGHGNWRPYGYYPAYSGYWQQCPSGAWCPQTGSCNSPACQ
jgi:hypothetical protein